MSENHLSRDPLVVLHISNLLFERLKCNGPGVHGVPPTRHTANLKSNLRNLLLNNGGWVGWDILDLKQLPYLTPLSAAVLEHERLRVPSSVGTPCHLWDPRQMRFEFANAEVISESPAFFARMALVRLPDETL